ncbi:hypothetical protein BJ170DRAFT_602539 [Xylariales sp. AK1849]|nr:hypothetical protein BJ170DRAFT_602539 [Xylariales sp. AK1849]
MILLLILFNRSCSLMNCLSTALHRSTRLAISTCPSRCLFFRALPNHTICRVQCDHRVDALSMATTARPKPRRFKPQRGLSLGSAAIRSSVT